MIAECVMAMEMAASVEDLARHESCTSHATRSGQGSGDGRGEAGDSRVRRRALEFDLRLAATRRGAIFGRKSKIAPLRVAANL